MLPKEKPRPAKGEAERGILGSELFATLYCTGGQMPLLGAIPITGIMSSKVPLLLSGPLPFLRKVATRSEKPFPLPEITGSIGRVVKLEKMLTQLFEPIGSALRKSALVAVIGSDV